MKRQCQQSKYKDTMTSLHKIMQSSKFAMRFISVFLIAGLFCQIVYAEDMIISTGSFYEAEKSFSINDDLRNSIPTTFGQIGKLRIHGDGLTLLEESDTDVPVYIVNNGQSVQFSLVDIKDHINIHSDFAWKLVDTGASKIEQFDWKKKIGVGGILVQTSYDNDIWETVYSNTNVFSDYSKSIDNFYSARRIDLDSGCYYKVVIAYKMSKKAEQKNFLFFDTSSWKEGWYTNVYTFFIVSDESSVTAANVDYSDLTVSDDSNTGIVGSVFGNQTTSNRLTGEEDFYNSGNGNHGYAAEAANVQSAAEDGILKGEKVTHTGYNNAKNGPDYTITSQGNIITEIQSKYCNSPSATLKECFDDTGLFRYYSEPGVPMAIEVPADQYDSIIRLMRNKISQGLVPGVTDPAEAENIIRKGSITYTQAVNIAKAGNIDSLIFDAKNSCVSTAQAFGISAVVTFATSIWNKDTVDVALQKSMYTGLEVGGNVFVTSVLASQLSRTGLNSLLVPGSEAIVKAIGPKASAVIVNAARIGAKPIYGAAAMKSAAKLLRGNIITATISLTIFTVPDIIDIFRGRISGKQLLKNIAGTAGGIGGGMAGAAAGAAVGSIIPGPGTIIGGIVGAVGGSIGGSLGADALADLIAEDDADDMLDIITVEFQNLAEEYLLNNNEANNVSIALQEQLTANELKNMFSASNQHEYARDMVENLIKDEIDKREDIVIPSDEILSETLVDVLEDIYDEADLDEIREAG